MNHVGEVVFRDFDGEGFNLAGPHRRDPIADRREGKPANAIEEASHSKHFLLSYFGATVCTTVRVVLTAAWAV